MSQLADVVRALKTEVVILEAWAKDQNEALVAAKAAAEAKNGELTVARAEIADAQREISDLSARLAAVAPGTDDAVALVADIVDVINRLDAITPEPVADIVIPVKPTVVGDGVALTSMEYPSGAKSLHNEPSDPVPGAEPIHWEPTTLTADPELPLDVPVVLEEAGSTSTSTPDAEVVDAGHNGET